MSDLLIAGGTVLTMDGHRRVLDDGAVFVRDTRIAEVGPAAELRPRHAGVETIDATGMAVMPGLIDAHGHAGHGLTKGIADTSARRRGGRSSSTSTTSPRRPTSGSRSRGCRPSNG